MRFFRALRFWSGQCRECGTGSPVAEMANMLSTTTPPPQRYASMRGTRGRRCGNDGTLGRSKRDPQAFYDKGYLNCRFAWDYARTPICRLRISRAVSNALYDAALTAERQHLDRGSNVFFLTRWASFIRLCHNISAFRITNKVMGLAVLGWLRGGWSVQTD